MHSPLSKIPSVLIYPWFYSISDEKTVNIADAHQLFAAKNNHTMGKQLAPTESVYIGDGLKKILVMNCMPQMTTEKNIDPICNTR